MVARLAYVSVSIVILFALAPAIACAQGSIDISLPPSYIINATKGYDPSSNAVDIWGNIEFIENGDSVYLSIPTNAPAGVKLAFFQDTGTRVLFRNNTLLLPINDTSGPVANLVLMTGDMRCDNGKFYGQVTGIEVDTKTMGGGDAMASAVLYLSRWHAGASYRVSISSDDQVKKSVMAEASKNGQAGNVKLMLNVNGTSQGSSSSIGYAIVHMKIDGPGADGNVSAYRYHDGAVSKLTCKAIRSNDSVVYETISSGGGTFVFVGQFREPPPVRASLQSVLTFSGMVASLMLLLVGTLITAFKKLNKKS